MIVCGEAADDDSTLNLIRQRDWDLVVLDLSMRGRGGLDLIRLIKAERPRLPILAMSASSASRNEVHAIRAGASGYLSHRTDTELLLSTMRRVSRGRELDSRSSRVTSHDR